jgi:hypothetical protein
MRFVKVTAKKCDVYGEKLIGQNPTVTFFLNVDLIGAINGKQVLIKAAKVAHIGGDFYTDLRLVESIDLMKI